MNPIAYNQLFDIDGLTAAVKENQAATDQLGTAATNDFKRINGAIKSLIKDINEMNTALSKPIRLSDDSGQAKVRELAQEVSKLTEQYKTQQAALKAMNDILNSNKQAMSDAKTKAAEYAAELKKEQVATQELRTAIAQLTLDQKKEAQAKREATQAQTAATGSYNEAQKRLSALGKEIKNAENGFKSLSPEINKKILQYNSLNDSLKAFDAQMGNHQRNVGNYSGAIDGAVGSLTQLALGYVSLQGILSAATATFDKAMETDSNRAALGYILNSTDQASDRIEKLKETANRLGLEFVSLTKTYSSFIGAAKASNFDMREAENIFNSVAGAGAKLHLSADQVSGSLLAIQQMISKGTVSSEELRGQLGERLPGAFSIAARAVGVTEVELGKMLKSGELLASDLLPKLSAELDKTFNLDKETRIESIQASWNRLKNSFSTAVDENGNVKIFFQSILDSLTAVSTKLFSTVNSSSFKEFFLRVAGLTSGGAVGAGFSSLADTQKFVGSFDSSKNAISDFREADAKKQLEYLNTQRSIRDAAYKAADSGNKADIKFYNEQQALLQKLTNIYREMNVVKKQGKYIDDADLNSLTEIRKRITELSKMPGSAADGSDINNRIDALKARLKSLTPSTKQAKDGFQLLEEQIKKTLLLLQDNIIKDDAKNKGVQTAKTLELASSYNKLVEQLDRLKERQKTAQTIAAFGSNGKLPTLSGRSINPSVEDIATGIGTASAKSYLTGELETTEKFSQQIQDAYKAMNDGIFKDYKDRKITITQYNEQIQIAQDSAAEDLFEQDKKAADIRLKLAINQYGLGSKEYVAALKARGDLEEKYNKESFQRDQRLYAARQALLKEVINSLKNSASVISGITGNGGLGSLFGNIADDLIGSINEDGSFDKVKLNFQQIADIGMSSISAYTQFAINASEQRIEQLNKEKEHELLIAGDNKEAKEKIEAEYSKKVTAEKRKQATLNKVAAIAEIAINTAVAVTKTAAVTGPLAFLLAPAIIALGAIEAGIVLAQPLPQYASGRDGGNAELAEVNERGPELIGQKGKWRFANRGMRGVTYLNKGDQVKTATDTKQMLANGMITADGQYVNNVSQSKAIYDNYIMASNKADRFDYGRMSGAVADGLIGLPITEHNYNERGYQSNVRSKNTRRLDINRRNQF